jgi:DNA-binding protein YbaB
MFDQLKDIYNLRKQAQEIEKQLVAEKIEGVSADQLVKIVINGKHDLLEVELADSPAFDKKRMAEAFKEAFASANAKLERVLMDKFKGMV